MAVWPDFKPTRFKTLLLEAQFHGAKRLAERKFGIWWAVAHLLLLCGALLLILSIIHRYLGNPTYLIVQEFGTRSLNSPAVLICPEVDFPDHRMDTFIEYLKIPPNVNATRFRANLRQMAAYYAPDVKFRLDNLKVIEQVLEYNLLELEEAARTLTTSCEESILKCRWLGEEVNCTNLFKMELTPYGFCCAFNVRSLKREIANFGLHKAKAPEKLVVQETGPYNGLIVAINCTQNSTNVDLAYKWLALLKGQTYSEVGVNGTPISPSIEHWVTYNYKRVVLDDDTRRLSKELRQCELYETPLKFFPVYSKSNCIVECEMRLMWKRCRCMRLTHPRPPNIPYCKANMLRCMKNAAVSYVSDKCRCFSTCDTDNEIIETQTFQLIPNSYSYNTFYDDLDLEKVAVIRVFTNRQVKKQYTRRAYFGPIELFAQLGGCFSVTFGCSVFTLLEISQLILNFVCGRLKNKYLKAKELKKKPLATIPEKAKKDKKKINSKNLNVKWIN